jgi:hypothetical protein
MQAYAVVCAALQQFAPFQTAVAIPRQYLYFCTSKASQLTYIAICAVPEEHRDLASSIAV